jgi:hypothetical protein
LEEIKQGVQAFDDSVAAAVYSKLWLLEGYVDPLQHITSKTLDPATQPAEDRCCSICFEALENYREGKTCKTHAAVHTSCGHILALIVCVSYVYSDSFPLSIFEDRTAPQELASSCKEAVPVLIENP